MVKLQASLRDQNLQLQRVAVTAADLEDALMVERKHHHATREELQRMRCRLEEVFQETMDLRYRAKISDDVLQALRETSEVDVSDQFCLSGLIQEVVYRAARERASKPTERFVQVKSLMTETAAPLSEVHETPRAISEPISADFW